MDNTGCPLSNDKTPVFNEAVWFVRATVYCVVNLFLIEDSTEY